MISEPMLDQPFDFEWDGMDERGAHTVNVWCNECGEGLSGLDAYEATEWSEDHECPTEEDNADG